jgi:hypothetical protein
VPKKRTNGQAGDTLTQKWVVGAVIPVLVAIIGGVFALSKQFWRPEPAEGRLVLATATTRTIEDELADAKCPPETSCRKEVPVVGVALKEYTQQQIATMHAPDSGEPKNAGSHDVMYKWLEDAQSESSDTCGNRPFSHKPNCKPICTANCCALGWKYSRMQNLNKFGDSYSWIANVATGRRSNNLGVVVYVIEQSIEANPPAWYRSDKECAALIYSAVTSGIDIPGERAPLELDLLVSNTGQTETQVTGYRTKPLLMEPIGCAGGGLEYNGYNKNPLPIRIDNSAEVVGRFDTQIGIPPRKTVNLRTRMDLPKAEQCGESLLYELSLLYFDGKQQQELFVGNFYIDVPGPED